MTLTPHDASGAALSNAPLAFLDIESTGLSPGEGHRVCEVALLRVRGETVEARYNMLVNPLRPMNEQAAAVHGITPELLEGAPHFHQIAPHLLALLDGTVIVAHNAPFDVAFLNGEFERGGLPPLANPVLDTLVLARRLLRRPSHSLRALAKEFQLPAPTHRAMSDVLALQGLFAHLAALLGELGIATLHDALRFQRGLLPGQPELPPPPLIAQALQQGRKLHIIYRSLSSPEPTERVIRPIEVTQERSGAYLRAYCYLRNDLRSFALEKIDFIELVD
ncbi:MAG: WYL domain-containing protein [Chloroflexales bacterium]|nr:WYL domain-containing protein [Chloroflexales bacterium]